MGESESSRMLRVRVEEEVIKEEGDQRLTWQFFPELVLLFIHSFVFWLHWVFVAVWAFL